MPKRQRRRDCDFKGGSTEGDQARVRGGTSWELHHCMGYAGVISRGAILPSHFYIVMLAGH